MNLTKEEKRELVMFIGIIIAILPIFVMGFIMTTGGEWYRAAPQLMITIFYCYGIVLTVIVLVVAVFKMAIKTTKGGLNLDLGKFILVGAISIGVAGCGLLTCASLFAGYPNIAVVFIIICLILQIIGKMSEGRKVENRTELRRVLSLGR